MNDKEDPDAEQGAQDLFLEQLDEMEALLSKHTGPYLVGWVPKHLLGPPLAPAVLSFLLGCIM